MFPSSAALLATLALVLPSAAAPASHPEMKVTDADRQHWAFLPLRKVMVPTAQDSAWARTPLDQFIRLAQEEKGLLPSAMADSRTLVRRIYFDLVGLPPTPEEFKKWSGRLTNSRDAWSELVEELLASPHYGERWARHWLDVARYADSNGMEGDDDRPNAYHYRDFVISALNEDMPCDQFMRWQLAGDEIAPDKPEAIAATGFIVAGTSTIVTIPMEEEKQRIRANELDDMVSTTGQAMLGLTLACARCHDHKYDPLPTRDYYRLMSIFNSGDRCDVPMAPPAQVREHAEAVARWQQQPADASRGEKPSDLPATFAFADFAPEPRESWLFERGDFMSRKEKLEMGFLTVLMTGKTAGQYWQTARDTKLRDDTTQQRRALAGWMTDLEDGAGRLLARVMVNRVWQHHFGEGIVRTVSDFGRRGEPPTHPEMLEWLTNEFIRSGWSVKHLHRLILKSAVYQQTSLHDERKAAIDPENRLLWRRRPLRLESEILRDSMLAAAGTLNPAMFGPSFKPPIPAEALQARNVKNPYPGDAGDSANTRRRTIYMFHKRVIQYPLMQAFDAPDAQQSCGRRMNTTVAPQALAILNDPFVRLRAGELATSLLVTAGPNPQQQIRDSFQRCLNRDPMPEELAAATEFLAAQIATHEKRDAGQNAPLLALTDFCQSLLGLNEFLYID